MEQIKSAELPEAGTLQKEEIEQLLPELDGLISWAKGVQDYALQKALAGEKYNGYKVVEGRATKKWTDPDAVLKTVVEKTSVGEAMMFKPREMISVSDTEKLLGRVQFKTLLENFVDKGTGKPTLVPDSDKRPEYGTTAATNDFMEVINK